METELIRIKTNENNEPLVSARELHEKLQVKTKYNDWFTRMCEYGFVENQDYTRVTQKKVTAQGNETTLFEHVLKLDMAKEICMIQRSEIGKKFRQYFIECEKKLKQNAPALPTYAEALRQLADKVEENERLQLENKELKPKALFADAVETSQRSCLVAELAKILKQNGVDTGQNRLFKWLRESGYLGNKGEYYNQPTQKAMDMGLFELKKRTVNNPDGTVMVVTTTKVTPKGQIYFVNKLIEK